MFKELMPVIKHRPLTITVALLPNGKIRACIIPQSLESDGKINDKVTLNKEIAKIPEPAIKALTTPLAITGTAEELDGELAQQLTAFADTHGNLQNGIEQATREITNALRAIQEREKIKSKTKAASSAAKNESKEETGGKEEPPSAQGSLLPANWLAAPVPAAVSSDDRSDNPQGTEVSGS